MPTPLQRQPLRDLVYRQLADAIADGELAAGDRIPLAATADRMGISMTPLRESLVMLQADGLVTGDPGCGYSVASLRQEEIEELYPLMGGLEALAIELGPPDLDGLLALDELNARLATVETAQAAHALDREWHRTLVANCANRPLMDFLTLLRRRAARYEVATMTSFFDHLERSVEHHRAIVAALRADDPVTAGLIVRKNWRVTPDFLIPKEP